MSRLNVSGLLRGSCQCFACTPRSVISDRGDARSRLRARHRPLRLKGPHLTEHARDVLRAIEVVTVDRVVVAFADLIVVGKWKGCAYIAKSGILVWISP